MYSRNVFYIVCLLVVSKVWCFSVGKRPLSSLQVRSSPTCHRMSSKEEEIRELEEKLQQLKKEAIEEEAAASAVATTEEEEEVVKLNEQAVFTELLTEQWKEEEAAEEGGLLKNAGLVLAGIGLVIGLAWFSQVPIGQEDLSKYSTPSRQTSTQIDLGDLNRARQSGDI